MKSIMTTQAMAARADYGQDAPGIRLAMAVVALGGLLTASVAVWLASSVLAGLPWLRAGLLVIGVCALVYGAGMAGYMTWSSRIGKLRTREALLDKLGDMRPWTGDETMLDIGCGRGLMAVGAARRLRGGTVTGLDLWRSQDLSGNAPEFALANAAVEGVAARVRIATGDARSLPLDDSSVDVVLSHWVVHNLDSVRDRGKALDEMWRVLRPGGAIVLADIAHLAQYRDHFLRLGADPIEFLDGGLEAKMAGLLTGGTFRPQALLCKKP